MEDKDPSALKIFEEGLHADPKNEQVQTGLQKSIEEKKVELALATPKPGLFIDHTPPPAAKPEQMADLALTMLASGRVYDAAGIFKEENFPKEKQSQAVRETFVEVRLGMILEKAKHKACDEALAAIDAIGDEDQNLPFSMYGFGAILKTARIQYQLAVAEDACGQEKAARKRWSKAAKAAEHGPAAEVAWGTLAAGRIEGGDAKSRLEQALEEIQGAPEAAPGWQGYARGVLLKALGRENEAEASFQQAVQSSGGDIVLNYLCRVGAEEK